MAADLTNTSLSRFPAGSCSDASILLGEHLLKHGFGDWEQVSGERRTGHLFATHAWLERDGLIVDITADQFADVDAAVIVTTDPAFHRTFKVDRRNVARIEIWDVRTQAALRLMYERVGAAMSEMC
ncbi:MAG: hypothetical protein ACRDTE_20305 [Pseudonocardiaceae bacterium]